MKTKSIPLTIFLFLLTGTMSASFAQFQGNIEMKTYSEDRGTTEVNTLNMFVTSDRIMLQGEENVNIADNMDAKGLLIRNDKKDFVVLMGENQGIQVTKPEIEGLINMFSSWGGESASQPEDSAPDYRFSERTKTILGKECAEMIIENDDNPNKYLSIWLTPNVDINWGMLAEPWKNIPSSMEKEINNMSQDILFQGKNFPMLIEAYDEDGTAETLFEVTKIEESNVAKAMVEIPSGTTLVGAKEFMFNMMMQQQ